MLVSHCEREGLVTSLARHTPQSKGKGGSGDNAYSELFCDKILSRPIRFSYSLTWHDVISFAAKMHAHYTRQILRISETCNGWSIECYHRRSCRLAGLYFKDEQKKALLVSCARRASPQLLHSSRTTRCTRCHQTPLSLLIGGCGAWD